MNKGFTLVELLAVLVILSIIVLIGTPILLNVIENAELEGIKKSIQNYGDAFKTEIARLDFTGEDYYFDELDTKIKYSGNKVECDTKKLLKNNNIYLGDCRVNDESVDFTYGTKKHKTPPMIETGHTGNNIITGYTLARNSNGGLDIYVSALDEVVLKYSNNGGAQSVINPVIDQDDIVYYPIPIALAEGANTIVIKLYVNNVEVDSLTTSIKEYCRQVLNNSEFKDSHEFIKAYIYMSDAVYISFKKNTLNLIGDIIDTEFDSDNYKPPIHWNYIGRQKYFSGNVDGVSKTLNVNVTYSANLRFIFLLTLVGDTTIDDIDAIYNNQFLEKKFSSDKVNVYVPFEIINMEKPLRVEIVQNGEVLEILQSPIIYYISMFSKTTSAANKVMYASILNYWEKINEYYYE